VDYLEYKSKRDDFLQKKKAKHTFFKVITVGEATTGILY
jgi:hypothetical protein